MTETDFKSFCRRHQDALYLTALVLIVGVVFVFRINASPLIGEETRYGTAAREMIDTGDWLVFRQQGQVFAERPPLTIWAVATVGLIRGEVDAVAVRLTSILAIVLTSLLLYLYVRSFASSFAAFTAGLIYPTMAQVLQIGRLGETEPLFGLLLSGSLMLWHLGYLKHWPPLRTWCVGFAFAALAALAKGPQAPVYFVSITGMYLLIRRDWRFLFNWSAVAGAGLFVLMVGAWQVPYFLVTDWESVVATWTGLAQDRIRLAGLAEHMVKFPLETFACLLPWSPMLLALMYQKSRQRLVEFAPVVTFLIVAVVVAYPSVWLAVGARGRYFIPLYPCFAALIGLIVERTCTAETGTIPRLTWDQFLVGFAVVTALAGLVFVGIGIGPSAWIESFHQPRWFALLFAAACLATCWCCVRGFKQKTANWNLANVVSIGLLVGIVYSGIFINSQTKRWNDPTQMIAELKSQIPPSEQLVSLGPVDHRFVFYHQSEIEQVQWPTVDHPIPDHVNYFVFMRRPEDTPQQRSSGRGRTWHTTPGTVPFEWEEVVSINCNRVIRDHPQPAIVLGRVVRPLRVANVDVTQPQSKSSVGSTILR